MELRRPASALQAHGERPGRRRALPRCGRPIDPRPAANPNPISTAFVEAAREQGRTVTDDFNGEQFEGAGYHDLLIKDGRRQSAAVAYLHPAVARGDVELVTGAHVHELVFAGDRCTGVRYEREGRIEELLAAEVVVCAGAVDSPSLLMRSGIGPAEELARAGVDVRVGPPRGRAQPARPPAHGRALGGRPAGSAAGVQPRRVVDVRPQPADALVPDLHFMFIHVPFHLPTYSVAEGSWTIAVGLVRPASRGTLRITSGDPAAKPVIDPAYLTERADLDAMVAGLEQARELAAAHAFDAWRGAEALPGEGVRDPEALRDFVRHAAGTYYHPVGTCRMGTGPDAVVDPELRVRGVESLRVADASIMPDIVSANTNTAALLIGEKAADLVKGSEPTPIDVGNARVGV